MLTGRRAFSLGLVLASLAVGGWQGMIPHVGSQQTGQIATESAFLQATSALEAFHNQAGSYAGAELAPTSPVQLAWSDDTSYCLQGGGLHELGPGGLPQQGACAAPTG